MFIYRLLKKFIIRKILRIKPKKPGYHNCMKGKFKVKNISKYKGNPNNVVYRSSWEMKVMRYLDNHKDVLWWQSEELAIKYLSPVDGKVHRYFVDFICNIKDKNGNNRTLLIEVKPKKQTMPPKKPAKITKSYIKEALTWGVNEAKWKAAKEYCLDHKYEFMIFTEDDIFGSLSFR